MNWWIWHILTPKVSCLNFGVQSLFDSKSSKLKELTKISGGKVWSDHPYMVGNLGVKNTKSIMHQTWHAVSEWRPDVKTERTYQNFRGQSVVRPPQTDNIIVCHLIRIILPNYYSLYYLGWISEMLGTGGKSYFKQSLL